MSPAELVGGVGGEAVRLRRQVVAAQVGRDDAEARLHERRDLLPPAVPELREAVQQDDERPVAGLDVVQLHVADLGVPLAKAGAGVDRRAGGCVGVVVVMTLPWRGGCRDNHLAPVSPPSRPWDALVCTPSCQLISAQSVILMRRAVNVGRRSPSSSARQRPGRVRRACRTAMSASPRAPATSESRSRRPWRSGRARTPPPPVSPKAASRAARWTSRSSLARSRTGRRS